MKEFTKSKACASRAFCQSCRTDPKWREASKAPETCPYGVVEAPARFRVKMRNVTVNGVPCRGCGGKVIEFRQTT